MGPVSERGIQVTSFIMLCITAVSFGLIGIGLVGLGLFFLSHNSASEPERMAVLMPISFGLGGSAVAIAARMWTVAK